MKDKQQEGSPSISRRGFLTGTCLAVGGVSILTATAANSEAHGQSATAADEGTSPYVSDDPFIRFTPIW